jgi:hypothetical protein
MILRNAPDAVASGCCRLEIRKSSCTYKSTMAKQSFRLVECMQVLTVCNEKDQTLSCARSRCDHVAAMSISGSDEDRIAATTCKLLQMAVTTMTRIGPRVHRLRHYTGPGARHAQPNTLTLLRFQVFELILTAPRPTLMASYCESAGQGPQHPQLGPQVGNDFTRPTSTPNMQQFKNTVTTSATRSTPMLRN